MHRDVNFFFSCIEVDAILCSIYIRWTKVARVIDNNRHRERDKGQASRRTTKEKWVFLKINFSFSYYHYFLFDSYLQMATAALPKSIDNPEIAEYMENLSKEYFSKIFPNLTISIEAKPKCGKQGGHIVILKSDEASSTKTIKVIYKYN